MEKRLVTYKPIRGETIKVCCLKKIEQENLGRPGMRTTCPRCGTFLKCCWLDFNQAKSYKPLEVYQKKTNIEDFIPLSALVVSRYGETSKQLSKKFVILFDNVKEESLERCQIIDSESGREYIFNKDVNIEEMRVMRLGEDVFVILGKVTQEEKDSKDDFLGISFTKKSKASLS